MDKTLNKEQLQAINHGEGPLLIIAGAGTGKTTVITQRIACLLEKKLATADEILALTFTEKAAREMETRVDEIVPYGYTNMWISTFHSFCDRILRREALQIGYDPKYKLMTTGETIQLIKANFFSFDLKYFRPLGNPYKFIDGLLNHFARLQDENITPAEYLKWVKKQKGESEEEKLEIEKWNELANAYRVYEELKVREGKMDYGDLIVKTIKLFKDRPNILSNYQKQFKYILIDEFQDTNYAQNELALLLATKCRNLTVVADDDQSIYRFRGAAISNILQFSKNFPDTKIVVLTKNYRSTQTILDDAYKLIQFNNPDRLEVVEKINKKLTSERKVNLGETVFVHTSRVENEADEVAKKIQEFVSNKKYSWSDFAILVRANNHADPFMKALQRYSIPFQFLGPGKLFRQTEIVDLISYLRVLYDIDDSISLLRVLTLPHFDINARDIAKLGSYARKHNLSLFESAEKMGQISEACGPSAVNISDDSKNKIKNILDLINKHLKIASRETAGRVLYMFLQDSGLIRELLSPDEPEAIKRAANISRFFDKLKSYETEHEEAGVREVVDWIDLSMEVGESPLAADSDWSEVDAVNILTVHSSKGLEFPVVFLVNLVAQRFPTIERREQIPIPEDLIKEILPTGDYHLEEERRLFYVGMTRAKDCLYLTASDFYGEAKREKKISQFVIEALGEKILNSKSNLQSEQLSFIDFGKKDSQEVFEKKKFKIDYLSYSQIETFEICPLHYKLKYILNIPTPETGAQSMGVSLHETMKDFYTEIKGGAKPTPKLMKDLLDKNWISAGFKSKKHEIGSKEKIVNYLKDYLKHDFSAKNLPEVVEQPFLLSLTHKGQKIKIGGKIDRVDLRSDGTIEIIDYKTGENVPTQKEVDKNMQLTFYALAATQLADLPFNKKPEEVNLSLYYFEGRQKLTTKRTRKELDEAIEEIFRIKDEIENSDFTCSGNFLCQNCEFGMFCKKE